MKSDAPSLSQQVASLKLQAAGHSDSEDKSAESGARQRRSFAAQNEAAWEARLAASTKASQEAMDNLAARHHEAVEVRWYTKHEAACGRKVLMLERRATAVAAYL